MYINLTEDSGEHIGYVNCRPTMSDTVGYIKDALEEHFDEKLILPESLEQDLKNRDHNELHFICKAGNWDNPIIVSDGWVY